MAWISLVVGILSLLIALVPGNSYLMLAPACIGLIFGIIALAEQRAHRGPAIAGLVLNSAAALLCLLWTGLFAAATMEADGEALETENPLLDAPLPSAAPELKAPASPAPKAAR